MEVYYSNDKGSLYNCNCLDLMKTMGDGTVDCIATDPPYGYSFMGKDWDRAVPLGAIIPDLDIAIQTIFKVNAHRRYLHNIFVPMFIMVLGYASATHRFTIFLAIGVMVHLLADSITKGRMYYLWPVSNAHTGGGMSFTRPKGGKTIIKKINNEAKSMISHWVFIGFTVLELALMYLARVALMDLMRRIML